MLNGHTCQKSRKCAQVTNRYRQVGRDLVKAAGYTCTVGMETRELDADFLPLCLEIFPE